MMSAGRTHLRRGMRGGWQQCKHTIYMSLQSGSSLMKHFKQTLHVISPAAAACDTHTWQNRSMIQMCLHQIPILSSACCTRDEDLLKCGPLCHPVLVTSFLFLLLGNRIWLLLISPPTTRLNNFSEIPLCFCSELLSEYTWPSCWLEQNISLSKCFPQDKCQQLQFPLIYSWQSPNTVYNHTSWPLDLVFRLCRLK